MINDCEVKKIRDHILCVFSSIFPKDKKLNNWKSSSKFNFRIANVKYFKDN